MNVDLDINNYNYNDLLNIFKIKKEDIYYSEKNINKINEFREVINKKFPDNINIHSFYLKTSKILECLYQLLNKNIIFDMEDDKNIDLYVNKIKLKNLETNNVDNIIDDLINSNTINEDKYIQHSLNEPNYNVSGRVNPSLNNKNNTNNIVNTYSNSLAPGYLNSIKRISQFQNLNLNSCFRNNYYTSSSTDFQYLIPVEIKNVVSMRLASIEIPNAWYLFSSKQKNNYFNIEMKINNQISKYTINIPDGNYDNDTLQHYLNTTYFCNSQLDHCLKYLKFVIDSHNFKSRFEIVQDSYCYENICFSIFFLDELSQNLMNTTGWIMGFRLPTYLNISDQITSEGLFDGSGDRYIYLVLSDYQYNNNGTNIVGFDKSIMDDDILAKIPMINGKLSLVIDDNNNPLTKTRRYNGPVNIRKIQIKILDKFGSIIDLNNMDFSFTLELEILYESFNFKDVTS
jgi:hypothetical protein